MTDIHSCSYYCDRPECIKAQRDELRAALAAQPVEPDMRHPKIQKLIGQNARQHIWMMLVEQLVEDPNFETTSMDMEYWDTLHDKLKEKLTAAPPAPAACVAEERERCAQICSRAMPQPVMNWCDAQIVEALRQCAEAIRAQPNVAG